MPIEGGSSLADLLVIEDHPAFAEVACPTTGVLAWPAIRMLLFRMLLEDLIYPTASLIALSSRRKVGRRVLNELRVGVDHLRTRPDPSEVLIIGTGAGLEPRDGRLFNRYTDYFADELGHRAWTIESLYGHRWPSQPRSNRRLSLLSDHRMAGPLEGRGPPSRAVRAIASDLVSLAAERGRDLLGWTLDADRRTGLTKLGARGLAAYPAQERFAHRLLDRIRPRLVLAEEGCYGRMAVFNAVARERGVRVAEFQHGMVTRNHDAYNVAPHLEASPAYEATQPAAFLAYGPWWNEQFNTPVDEKVAIGNPARTAALRTWSPGSVRDRIIVLGDGIETEATLGLCRGIAKSVPDPFKVVFRPHPLERASPSLASETAITIDPEPGLYTSLGTAQAVIGEATTVLYEAIGLVPMIYAWDTPKSRFYLGDHPFGRLTDPEELASAIREGGSSSRVSLSASHYWADDWRTALARYLETPTLN